jgi:hypothetical protein
MEEYKFHLYAAVPAVVVAGLLYFVDTTVLVKALVVSHCFTLVLLWIRERQLALHDELTDELEDVDDYFSSLGATEVFESETSLLIEE